MVKIDERDEPQSSRFRVNRKLVPLKILMFLMHGGMAALYPYLTLHMKSIGMTFTEIGLISLLVPFVSAIGPPIGGFLADKLGNYKIVLVGFALLSVASHLLMWFAVPFMVTSGATGGGFSTINELNLTMTCSSTGHSYLMVAELPPNCVMAPSSEPFSIRTIDMQDCTTNCRIMDGLSPSICHNGSLTSNCLYWRDFAGQSLRDVGVHETKNGSTSLRTTKKETGELVDMSCVNFLPSECELRCTARTNLNITCGEPKEPRFSRITTVALYTTFRLLGGIAVSTLFPILDSTALLMTEEHGGDLGIQRMFSLFGMVTLPPLSGYLNGLASRASGYPDFSPAFYIFAGMQLLSAIVTCIMSMGVRIPAEDIWRNIGRVLANPKVFTFVFMLFLAGIYWGFLENFLFIFMEEDLGSPKWLLGLTNTVSGLAAIPIVAGSTFFIKHLGHTKIIILCFFLYGVRFLSYAHIYNPFHILPVETLEAFTTSLLWVVASVYCGKMAPDYLATLQGIVGCVHYAVGRGIGSLLGGLMFEHLKARYTYFVFGWACIATGALYLVLHYAWLRRVKRPIMGPVPTEETPRERLVLQPTLTRKEEHDLEEIAKFEGVTKTFSRLSARTSSNRSYVLQ